MSEYSVEEVRAHARMLRECRINTEATRDSQQDKLVDICDAYADLLERIKADEGAVPVAEVYEYPRDHHQHNAPLLTGIRFTGIPLPVGAKLYAHPPAQAVQDSPCSLNEALNVIEKWADHGNQLHGDDVPRLRAAVDRIAPTAERVSQAESINPAQVQPLACPFCGTKASRHKDADSGSRWEYYCPNGHTGYLRMKEWNTRTDQPAERVVDAESLRALAATWREAVLSASCLNKQDLRPFRFIKDVESFLTAAQQANR